jgi:membrane-associated phospholipid phosphatase
MTRAKKTRVEKGDVAVARAAAPIRNHPLVRTLGELSEVADQPPLRTIAAATMVAGALGRSERLTLAGVRMLAAHQLATSVKSVIKATIDRTRPEFMLENGKYESGKGEHDSSPYNSFPSGHTAGIVAVARSIGRDYPKARTPALLLAAAISVVQIPRGKHYVSDVLAGALIGLVADALVTAAARRLEIT